MSPTQKKMHNSSTALPGNHSWPGVALFAVIFLLYVMVAPSFAVPGRWAGIVTAFAGMDPFRPVTRPVWSGLVALVSALPIANLGAAINVLTAAAGAGCCWLLYDMVRRVPFARGMYGLRDAIQKEEAPARLMAGLAAALFAAASLAMIRFSAYGDYAVTDMLLLLLALYPVLRYRETGRTGWLCMSCAFMGLALVEYPTAAMIFPVFLGWWILTIWRAQQRSFSVILAGLLSLFAGLVALGVFAAVLAGSGMAEIRDWAGTGTVLVEWTRLYFLELTRSVPRVGWLLIFGMTLVPFIAVMLRPLEESADFFSRLGAYSFRLVLIAVAVLVLFELPGSPAYVMGPGVQLLAPSIVVAVWSGFLIAYLVMTARQAGRRKLAGLLATAWFAALLFAGVRHVAAARVDHLKPVVAFAESIIGNLNGRDIVITDGLLDPQLQLAARKAGVDVNLLNLQAGRSREQAEYQARLFVDEESKSLALIGLPAALRDWVARDPQAMDRLAMFASPELLRLPAVAILPSDYFYVLQPVAESIDAEALLDRKLYERGLRATTIPEDLSVDDVGWFQLQYMNRWLSRLANDTGFQLDEQNKPALAVEAYRLALDIWPENPSALVNLLDQDDASAVGPGREKVMDQLQRIAEKNPRIMNVLYLHDVSGRLSNPAAMLVYAEQRDEAGDRDDLLRKLESVVGSDDERSRLSLARLYLRGKNPGQSEAIYTTMLDENPENLDAHYGLLQLAMIRGDVDIAKSTVQMMEDLGADPERLNYERAHISLLDGEIERAREQFLEITKRPGRNSDAWLALMQIGLLSQNESLIEAASEALRRDQMFAAGLLLLGDVALREGRLRDARANFMRALDLEPGHEETLLRLMLMANLERDAGAMQNYSGQLLAQNPEHPVGHWIAANVHILAGHYDLAKASLRRSLEARESAEALSELAFVLARQGEFAEALPIARRAVALDQNLARAWAVQADIEKANGLKDDAIGSIQMARAKNLNRSPGIDLLAAEIFMEFGRLDEADELLLGISPSSGLLDKRERKRWLELLKARGKSSEALAYTRQAGVMTATGGDDATTRAKEWFDQAVMAFAENRWVDARYYLSRARGQQPDHPLILGLSGRVEMMTGDFYAAAAYWQELDKLYPNNASVLAGLAATDLYRENLAEAGRKLDQATKIAASDLHVRIYRAALAARAGDERAIKDALGNPGTRALAFFASTLHAERRALQGVLDLAQFNLLIRLLFGLSPEQDAAGVLLAILPALQSAADGLEKENWPVVADALVRVREAGITWPALAYDLALANYRMTPNDATLGDLAAVLRIPGGQDFVGIFFLLCLMDGRTADAERLAGDLLDGMPVPDALLVRAAVRRDQGDVEGAWRVLEEVSTDQRSALGPWFDQVIPVLKKLKSDPNFTSWIER